MFFLAHGYYFVRGGLGMRRANNAIAVRNSANMVH